MKDGTLVMDDFKMLLKTKAVEWDTEDCKPAGSCGGNQYQLTREVFFRAVFSTLGPSRFQCKMENW